MNIIELANTVEDGDEVRRESKDVNSYHSLVYCAKLSKFYVNDNDTEAQYPMSQQDLTATDWVIIKKKTAFEKWYSENMSLPLGIIAKSAWNAALESLKEEIDEELSGLLIMQEIEELKVKE